jgi:hypothetical protein
MQCRREKSARERAADPETVLERQRKWRAESVEYRSEYRKANRSRYAAHAASRRAGLKTATPSWSESMCISALYRVADSLRDLGLDVQVDHAIPLRGETVSGLHVRQNLQILPTLDNQRKNNRFAA